MPNSQKGFAPILIILFIALVVGGYLIYSKNQTKINTPQQTSQSSSTINESTGSAETANWKTYTDPKYDYSIKYPADLFFNCTKEEVFQNGFYLYEGQGESVCTAGEARVAFSIDYKAPSKDYLKSPRVDCYSIQSESITAAGIMGTKYTNNIKKTSGDCTMYSAYAKNSLVIILDHKGIKYVIGFEEDKNKETKYKILSTLRFVDQIKLTDSSKISDWKTYTNDKDKFSIQYPPIYQHIYYPDVNKNETSSGATKLLDLEDWHSGEGMASGGYSGDHITLKIYPDSGDQWSQIPQIGPSDDTVILGGIKALKKVNKMGFIIIGPIKHKGFIYEFQFDFSYKQAYTTNFYNMISTFKFLN